jgi:predicted PhzF superfamily epimerase YddE/YHI9
VSKSAPFALVEAFCTAKPSSGNPAGVVLLKEWLPDTSLQSIAATINQAETAFVCPESGDTQRIRWFTPTTEVRLCGHATLAAATFLNPNQPTTFQSLSGPLNIHPIPDGFALDFPAFMPQLLPENPLKNLIPNCQATYRDRDDWIALLSTEKEVIEHAPDMSAIAQLEGRGLSITAPGANSYFVYRFFAPQAGVPEDHATGSAQTYLTPLWSEKLQLDQLKSQQLSPRGAEFQTQTHSDRVLIGGKSNILVTGQIHLP